MPKHTFYLLLLLTSLFINTALSGQTNTWSLHSNEYNTSYNNALQFNKVENVIKDEKDSLIRPLKIRLDYLFDRVGLLVNVKPNIDNCDHQFFISCLFKNRFRARAMLGFRNTVISKSDPFSDNHSWAIGFETILNKKDRNFFFSYGFEVGSRTYNAGKTFSITTITRLSYKLNERFILIAEPLSIGIAQVNNNKLPFSLSYDWELYSSRILALGVSISLH
ncbi:MAG: hypothetical protein RLZZ543_1179 [Bacteroidota bacterium]|jgi:hypothetical protein